MTYTWNTSGSDSSSGYGNELNFSSSQDPSNILKVRSYSSSNVNAPLVTAHTDLYSGGIGVTNRTENGGTPNHAIDNSGDNDLVLFEFDADDYSFESFKIGWS